MDFRTKDEADRYILKWLKRGQLGAWPNLALGLAYEYGFYGLDVDKRKAFEYYVRSSELDGPIGFFRAARLATSDVRDRFLDEEVYSLYLLNSALSGIGRAKYMYSKYLYEKGQYRDACLWMAAVRQLHMDEFSPQVQSTMVLDECKGKEYKLSDFMKKNIVNERVDVQLLLMIVDWYNERWTTN